LLLLIRNLVCLIVMFLGMELALNYNFTLGILLASAMLLAIALPIAEENINFINRKNRRE